MEAIDVHAEAWKGIRNGFESGRLAHAYVIVGSPRGNALHFAESLLKLLFCEGRERPCNECVACRQVGLHKHVDTLWIEPQSKSRQILIEDVRGLIRRMSQTSFEGGWKAGVVLNADCLNPNSENAMLKTLEEPPAKSLLLLVTDSPQSLLPTIASRCQKIVLSSWMDVSIDAEWWAALMELLQDLPPSNGLEAARLASRLKGLIDLVKAGISDVVAEDLGQSREALDESKLQGILDARINARLKEVKTDVFRTMLDWHRDVLMMTYRVDERNLVFGSEREVLACQAKYHTQGSALQAIHAVEGMARQLDRNIPDLQVFDEAFRKLIR